MLFSPKKDYETLRSSSAGGRGLLQRLLRALPSPGYLTCRSLRHPSGCASHHLARLRAWISKELVLWTGDGQTGTFGPCSWLRLDFQGKPGCLGTLGTFSGANDAQEPSPNPRPGEACLRGGQAGRKSHNIVSSTHALIVSFYFESSFLPLSQSASQFLLSSFPDAYETES